VQLPRAGVRRRPYHLAPKIQKVQMKARFKFFLKYDLVGVKGFKLYNKDIKRPSKSRETVPLRGGRFDDSIATLSRDRLPLNYCDIPGLHLVFAAI
jgi:hypothetical protein